MLSMASPCAAIAAFESRPGDDRLAARHMAAERKRNALQRLPGEAKEQIRPGDQKAAIRRLQRRDRDAGARERVGPPAVRAEPRPARAAERQHGCVRLDPARAIRRLEDEATLIVPSDKMMPQREPDAGRIEPAQPRAQQRRRLHGARKHPPARSDEGFLAERFAPRPQRVRRKCQDGGAQCVGPAIAREKRLERLAVRQVEPAAPRHQELAAGRRHAVVDRHLRAALRQGLRRHQAGRAGADHRDAFHANVSRTIWASALKSALRGEVRRHASPIERAGSGARKRSTLTRSSRS
jgi:hypothetical protein